MFYLLTYEFFFLSNTSFILSIQIIAKSNIYFYTLIALVVDKKVPGHYGL